VLCTGDVEIGSYSQTYRFTETLLVHFLRLGTVLNIVSFNERRLWPKISNVLINKFKKYKKIIFIL